MKNPNIKLVTGLAFLTAGLVLVYLDKHLLLFFGLATIIISELFTLRRKLPGARISAGFVPLIAALLLFGIAYRDGKVPLALVVALWFGGIAEEIFWWRKNRRLT